jgi:hypothetical protein
MPAPAGPPLAGSESHARWYLGAIVTGRRVLAVVRRGADSAGADSPSATLAAVRTMTAAVLAGLLVGGCGGGARQDAREPKGTFTLDVVHSAFPLKQSIARPTALVLVLRNTSPRTAPSVAVTLDSFDYTEKYPELASDQRPVWIVEQGPGTVPSPPVQSAAVSPPGGGQTAYVNTWALGPVAPGGTQTFVWHVVPVKAGVHTVHFTVAAGLAGNAKAQLASGGPVQGSFTVYVAPVPPPRHVNPRTGQVVPGRYPLFP